MFCYRDALQGMVSLWNRAPMYSFGYFVPCVSAFLLWSRRGAVAGLPAKPAPVFGGGLVALAVVAAVGAHLTGVQVVEQCAFLLSIVGAAALLFGTEFLRRGWVAFAYLLLMIPFWDGLTGPLHQPFQQFSAQVGVWMLHAVRIPAYQEGVFVHLPNVTLEVARACSGVNYLIAVIALGIPLAYLRLPTIARRVCLIAAAIVVAALANSLRVALIGLLAYVDVGSPLHGPFHVLHGLFVSGIGYVVLFAGVRMLAPKAARTTGESSDPGTVSSTRPLAELSPPIALALTAVFVLVGAVPMRYAPKAVRLAAPLDSLPHSVGEWRAAGDAASHAGWWLGADSELERRYQCDGVPDATVSAAYFAFQRQGRELVSYRLDRLFYGAQPAMLAPGPSGSPQANFVRLRVGSSEKVGFVWFLIEGEAVADRYRAKWLALTNLVVRGRNNGAMVVVLADRATRGGEQQQVDGLRRLSLGIQEALLRLTDWDPRRAGAAPRDRSPAGGVE